MDSLPPNSISALGLIRYSSTADCHLFKLVKKTNKRRVYNISMKPQDLSKLKIKIALYFPLAFIILGAVLFIPAGTLNYWQAWVFLIILMATAFFVVIYFFQKSPEFLERRLKFKEKEPAQSLIIAVADVIFFAGFIVAGLDFRFGWSHVPAWLVLLADLVVILSYIPVFLAFRQNPFAARTVEIFPDHKLINTGPYAIVRHPMYAGIIPMFLFMPLSLGSFWALFFMLPVLAIIVARTLNEEAVLKRHLPGYIDYCKKVRWRLIPYLW